MLYKGLRPKGTVPSSRYCRELDIIEATGWTHDEYLAQPADLVTELHIRLVKRAAAQRQG